MIQKIYSAMLLFLLLYMAALCLRKPAMATNAGDKYHGRRAQDE